MGIPPRPPPPPPLPSLLARPSHVPNSNAPAGAVRRPCVLGSVVVEFRPLRSWRGEFGFDWMRVTEAEADPMERTYIRNAGNALPFVNNNADFGLVQGGYGIHTGRAQDLTADQAQEKMKGSHNYNGEYEKFTIGRVPTNFRHLTYFVPYLNIYPQDMPELVLLAEEYPTPVARRCSTHLRMIIDIKGQRPNNIDIEFNRTDFQLEFIDSTSSIINKHNNISYLKIDELKLNYTATSDTLATSRKIELFNKELTLNITCLRELTENKEILVYSYHGNKNERRLAGKLIVLRNDAPVQRELTMVLVKVRTDINNAGVPTIGDFTNIEITNLYNTLHQALIHPRITRQVLPAHLVDIVLDLTADNNFKFTLPNLAQPRNLGNGLYVYGAGAGAGNINKGAAGFTDYIYNQFIAVYPNLTRANGYYPIFAFNSRATLAGNVAGHVFTDAHRNFIKGVALYNVRGNFTLAHEALHGLQLRHTHRDGNPPLRHQNIKYIFPHANGGANNATTNMMSYNGNNRHSTWRWQWEIMQQNV